MTHAPTLAQLRTQWHLGDDTVGRKAAKTLADAGITPADAAKMTPRQREDIRGLGTAGRARIAEQLHQLAAATARHDRDAAVAADKTKPGHCDACGGRRATHARSVVRDVWGHLRAANPATPVHLDDCQPCDTYHRNLVATRARELAAVTP